MTEPDLVSVLFGVKLVRADPAPNPEAQRRTGFGREAHALVLDAIGRVDDKLAGEIHESDGLKPLTVSDVLGYLPRRGLEAGRVYGLRVTGLTAPVTRAVLRAAAQDTLALGAEIRLGEAIFRVESVESGIATDPAQPAMPSNSQAIWAATTTYEALSAPWLLGRRAPTRRLALRFASPTTFKSSGKHVAAVLPAWVFGSLLEKWNAFAPVALPPEARRYAEECLALSGFELRSRPTLLKEGGVRIGAVGTARYTALNADRYWLSAMNLLADFALFAGVGAGTTMGLGQTRRLEAAAG